MGAIENHGALTYGYQLGGPADNWSGLANELVRYSDSGESWTMPQVSWTSQAMREESLSEHFAEAAVDRLSLDPPTDALWITFQKTRKCLVTCDDGSY